MWKKWWKMWITFCKGYYRIKLCKLKSVKVMKNKRKGRNKTFLPDKGNRKGIFGQNGASIWITNCILEDQAFWNDRDFYSTYYKK